MAKKPGVRLQRLVRLHAPDPWSALQFNIDTLWAILKKPLALCIRLVIAADEFNQLVMLQQRTFALHKAASCLVGLVAQMPVATRIQPEPTVTVGHMGPFGQRLFNNVIHSPILALLPQPSLLAMHHDSHCVSHAAMDLHPSRQRHGTR